MFKIKPPLYADINNAEVHDDDSTREEPPPSLSIINCSIDSKLSGKNFINTSDSFPDESQYMICYHQPEAKQQHSKSKCHN